MRLNYALAMMLVFGGVAAILGCAETKASRTPASGTDAPANVVIVELFTSEGCSSCPPADALLKKLSEEQPVPGAEIIALEEHVDYWDHLGWKDAFSSFAYTERQSDYAKKFGDSGVYTPQMIVDGETEFVGSRSREARAVIQKAAARPKLGIQLTTAASSEVDTAAFDIKIVRAPGATNGNEAEVWVAVTEKELYSNVNAGENSGEKLQHAAVVRILRKVDTFRNSSDYQTHASLKLNPAWQRNNLKFVAFAAEKNSRKIIGAATASAVSAPAASK